VKVRADAIAKIDCFSDIDNRPALVFHEIDARVWGDRI
jgi:hypothetical protein